MTIWRIRLLFKVRDKACSVCKEERKSGTAWLKKVISPVYEYYSPY